MFQIIGLVVLFGMVFGGFMLGVAMPRGALTRELQRQVEPLTVVLLLPIPLGNMLPAIAISLISLGVLERDGAWVLGGFAVATASMFVVAGVVYAMAKATLYLLVNAF